MLYASDYSENSVGALKYAHAPTEQLGMRLVIIHVLDCPTVLGTKGLGEPFLHLEETAFKNHRTKLEEICKQNLETD